LRSTLYLHYHNGKREHRVSVARRNGSYISSNQSYLVPPSITRISWILPHIWT